jgi:hypothetical protein
MVREQQYGEWIGDYDPSNPVDRRHKRAEDLARRVALGWIGHPAVAREVAAAKAALNLLVEPLDLPDQDTVTRAAAHFLGVAGFWPNGTEWPFPFQDASAALLEEAGRIQPLFVDALGALARRIESFGAPLDPTDVGVLLVLAQLTLLEPDFSLPAGELVDCFNLLPPGGFSRSAALEGHVATTSSRHGRNARFQADLAASAEHFASRVGPPAIRPPYSSGRKRATRGDTLRLRHALAVLVEQDSSLTARTLLGVDNAAENPALAKLRTALGGDADWLPDQRRVERNWPKPRQ